MAFTNAEKQARLRQRRAEQGIKPVTRWEGERYRDVEKSLSEEERKALEHDMILCEKFWTTANKNESYQWGQATAIISAQEYLHELGLHEIAENFKFRYKRTHRDTSAELIYQHYQDWLMKVQSKSSSRQEAILAVPNHDAHSAP